MTGGQYRKLEAESIRWFMRVHAAPFLAHGRILDYGAGLQPYRDLVGGLYTAYDRASHPASVVSEDVGPNFPLFPTRKWHAVMMNQVIQYISEPGDLLEQISDATLASGVLVMTYPTTWPEVEGEDMWRFTKKGMEKLLGDYGWKPVVHEPRAYLRIPGFDLCLGYGVICRK